MMARLYIGLFMMDVIGYFRATRNLNADIAPSTIDIPSSPGINSPSLE